MRRLCKGTNLSIQSFWYIVGGRKEGGVPSHIVKMNEVIFALALVEVMPG